MELIKEYSTGSLIHINRKNNLGRLERILLHPLSLCFLHFKWQQTRFFFYILLFCHFVFSMTYSGYVVLLYNTICNPLEWRDKVRELGYAERFQMDLICKTDTPFNEHLVIVLWISLVVFIMMYSIKEGTKFLHLRKELRVPLIVHVQTLIDGIISGISGSGNPYSIS